LGGHVSAGVGRMHYGLTRWVGTRGTSAADGYAVIPPDGEIRDGDRILVVGAGGPIVCGDCAVDEGSVVVGAPEGDVRAYLTTLRRLRAIDPPTLYPGHGPAIETPRETLERLIAHRLRRERRVLEAVDDGARSLAAILEGAYEKDLEGVRDLARATVRAHLEKLAVEGRLEWDGERATPREGRATSRPR
ncbi:MAG: hypothetical protein ACNA7R_15220, partial [Natronococcus sp.]